MKIMSSILPIVIMIGIGMLCKKNNLLSRTGTKEIKNLITSIILPVAVFHALATADYNSNMVILFLCMLIVLLLSFGLGFVLRPLLPEKYSKYLPFITSAYEGGMMAFPLYTNLFGEENLSHIAIFDIATMLFCFSIFIAMLQSTDSGKELNPSEMMKNAFRNPVFIAVILGIVCGMSGIIKFILNTDAGIVYLSMKNAITVILSSLILIVVGYDFEFDRGNVKIVFRAIAIRMLIQGVLFLPFMLLIRYLYPGNILIHGALLLYMSAPPSFSMQSYIEAEEPGKFVATTNSLYMIVTLAVYVLAAVTLAK